MHRIRTYVDTSVLGGLFDDEFREPTAAFFRQVTLGKYVLLISPVTLAELERAPKRVQEALEQLVPESVIPVALADECEELARAYVSAGALGQASMADALHVAVATVSGADLILSWNFKHIVNYARIRRFNSVNLALGYRPIEIRSPMEVAYDADNDQSV